MASWPSKLSPADGGTCDLKADAITPNSRWLNGPAFLLFDGFRRSVA